jgi:para-nitrobenzyl esterase
MQPIKTNLKFHNYKNYMTLIILLFGITTISACSSGSSSTVAGAGDAGNPNLLTGVFLDAPVEGLNYQTATISGVTDEFGTFMYHDGETVSFMIGDLMLGFAPGSDIMTPIDLVPGAVDETNPTVTNICRLLQSIDWDGDLSNGITITDTIRSELNGRMIDFTKTTADFNDYDIQAFFDTMHILGGFSDGDLRGLHTDVEAQVHFRQTLMEYDMYHGDAAFGPNQSGIGMGGMSQMN